MNNRRAFTLIELLVVIAIIALLVSILMPSLQKAKELAKDIVCRSNQKNISYGIMLYAEEHNGAIPPAVVQVGPSSGYPTPLWWHLRVGKVPEDQLPNDFPTNVPRRWAEPNHIIYQICRNGYVDYPSFGNNERVPYEGPFVCPSFIDQVNPKSRWEGATSCQFGINGGLAGNFSWKRNEPAAVTVTLVSDVRAGAVLTGDGCLNPGGNIRVDASFRPNSRGELYYRYPQYPLDFAPWTHQRHVQKWQAVLPCEFYGHSGDRANLSYADTHVESVAEINHKDWKIN